MNLKNLACQSQNHFLFLLDYQVSNAKIKIHQFQSHIILQVEVLLEVLREKFKSLDVQIYELENIDVFINIIFVILDPLRFLIEEKLQALPLSAKLAAKASSRTTIFCDHFLNETSASHRFFMSKPLEKIDIRSFFRGKQIKNNSDCNLNIAYDTLECFLIVAMPN